MFTLGASRSQHETPAPSPLGFSRLLIPLAGETIKELKPLHPSFPATFSPCPGVDRLLLDRHLLLTDQSRFYVLHRYTLRTSSLRVTMSKTDAFELVPLEIEFRRRQEEEEEEEESPKELETVDQTPPLEITDFAVSGCEPFFVVVTAQMRDGSSESGPSLLFSTPPLLQRELHDSCLSLQFSEIPKLSLLLGTDRGTLEVLRFWTSDSLPCTTIDAECRLLAPATNGMNNQKEVSQKRVLLDLGNFLAYEFSTNSCSRHPFTERKEYDVDRYVLRENSPEAAVLNQCVEVRFASVSSKTMILGLIASDGVKHCLGYGDNSSEQLTSKLSAMVTSPSLLPTLSDDAQVTIEDAAAAESFTLFLTSEGTVYGSGAGCQEQLRGVSRCSSPHTSSSSSSSLYYQLEEFQDPRNPVYRITVGENCSKGVAVVVVLREDGVYVGGTPEVGRTRMPFTKLCHSLGSALSSRMLRSLCPGTNLAHARTDFHDASTGSSCSCNQPGVRTFLSPLIWVDGVSPEADRILAFNDGSEVNKVAVLLKHHDVVEHIVRFLFGGGDDEGEGVGSDLAIGPWYSEKKKPISSDIELSSILVLSHPSFHYAIGALPCFKERYLECQRLLLGNHPSLSKEEQIKQHEKVKEWASARPKSLDYSTTPSGDSGDANLPWVDRSFRFKLAMIKKSLSASYFEHIPGLVRVSSRMEKSESAVLDHSVTLPSNNSHQPRGCFHYFEAFFQRLSQATTSKRQPPTVDQYSNSNPFDFSNIDGDNFSPSDLKCYASLHETKERKSLPQGTFVMVGPSGSGKSCISSKLLHPRTGPVRPVESDRCKGRRRPQWLDQSCGPASINPTPYTVANIDTHSLPLQREKVQWSGRPVKTSCSNTGASSLWTLWDLAGNLPRASRADHYKGADALIFVVDSNSTRPELHDAAKQFHLAVRDFEKANSTPSLYSSAGRGRGKSAPILIYVSKCHEPDSLWTSKREAISSGHREKSSGAEGTEKGKLPDRPGNNFQSSHGACYKGSNKWAKSILHVIRTEFFFIEPRFSSSSSSCGESNLFLDQSSSTTSDYGGVYSNHPWRIQPCTSVDSSDQGVVDGFQWLVSLL